MANNLLTQIHFPRWSELPNVDLYMDQVLNYMETSMPELLLTNEEEPCITKTMINNYVKQAVIEAPIKKKYTRSHIAKLFVITILKQIYNIKDIQKLIELAVDIAPIDIVYNNFCDMLEEMLIVTFSDKDYSRFQNLSDDQYALKTVIQSFVNKLYIQITYLNQKDSDKS